MTADGDQPRKRPGDGTALVTGAAGGIGAALARRLASDGLDLVLCDRADVSDLRSECEQMGVAVRVSDVDLSQPTAIDGLARQLREQETSIDVLVHCAGIYPVTSFDSLTWDEWRAVMALNLDALFLLSKAFLPGMRSRGWGRVVAIASTTFHLSMPGFAHYTASKGGVIGFVRALAKEAGVDGITVNALAPSLVRTPTSEAAVQSTEGFSEFFDQVAAEQAVKRTMVPDDLAGALAFLASDDAAFVSGQTLVVDGGRIGA